MTRRDQLSRGEIRKDAVQDAVEAATTAVGSVMTIIVGAVGEVAKTMGGLATDLFEIRDASRRASDDQVVEESGRDLTGPAGTDSE